MRFCVLSVAVLFFACPVFAQGDWPDWRGPTANGRTDGAGVPIRWSETENIVWKTGIHDSGHSTPVVWGDQVWLTTATEDGTVLFAVGIDRNSGEVIHNVEVFRVEAPQRIHPNNSYATPSAVIEEGRVYVHFGTFGTACINTFSGDVMWRRTDLNCDHMQGPVSSPVIFENLVIVHLEGVDEQFVAALNKKTGDTVWRYDRPAELYEGIEPLYLLKSYHTPVIVELEGNPQLVSNGAMLVTGHDPRTGKEIWRVRYRDDNPISRIVSGHGLLFVNTGGSPGKSQLWAIRQGGIGDVTDSHVVWRMTEDVAHESSPVLVDDLLYTMSDQGVLICTDAMTGKQVWSERLKGKYGASLLAAGDRIYLSNKKGMTTVIAAGREYRELAVNQLNGELWASPAVTGNALLLRTKSHLYRIERKE
jgi:outer membrane protein assembly factor BamB